MFRHYYYVTHLSGAFPCHFARSVQNHCLQLITSKCQSWPTIITNSTLCVPHRSPTLYFTIIGAELTLYLSVIVVCNGSSVKSVIRGESIRSAGGIVLTENSLSVLRLSYPPLISYGLFRDCNQILAVSRIWVCISESSTLKCVV
jgi:hypothetical protein